MAAGFAFNRNRHVPAEDTPAFGAIAERFRRGGDLERAVQLCRDGLTRFPSQLSARVTLGWALLDLGRHDEARAELEQVLRRAPDNLAAIRGLAALHDRAENAVVMDGPGAWPPDPETIDASAATAAQADAPSASTPPVPAEGQDAAVENALAPPAEDIAPAAPPVFVTSSGHEMPMASEDSAPPVDVAPASEEDADVRALLEESDRLGEAATDQAPGESAVASDSAEASVELLSPAAAAMAAATPAALERQPTAVADPVVDRRDETPTSDEPVDDAPVVEFSLDGSQNLDDSVVALEAGTTEAVEEPVVELSGASLDDLADVVEAMGGAEPPASESTPSAEDIVELAAGEDAPAAEPEVAPAPLLTQSSAPPTPEIGDLADLSPVVAAQRTAHAFAADLRAAAPIVLKPQTRATIVRLERFLKKVEARRQRLARESVA